MTGQIRLDVGDRQDVCDTDTDTDADADAQRDRAGPKSARFAAAAYECATGDEDHGCGRDRL